METSRTATEELILSTPRSQPPTPPNPGVRPEWRDVMIDRLAEKLLQAFDSSEWPNGWRNVAETAVDELIDRPEREFQQQLAAVVARNEEADSVGSWAPATASGWL